MSTMLRAGRRYEPSSDYVDGAYYDWLAEMSADWRATAVRPQRATDEAQRRAIESLIGLECRLLDQRAHEAWLQLYAPQCAYWIPAAQPAPDPRAAITLEFHDRRRLLDRVARLGTGLAFSQLPPSTTARVTSGLEVWAAPDHRWRARCSFVLAESRGGRGRVLAGWYGYALQPAQDGLRIAVKQINLIDCSAPQGNNSFFL